MALVASRACRSASPAARSSSSAARATATQSPPSRSAARPASRSGERGGLVGQVRQHRIGDPDEDAVAGRAGLLLGGAHRGDAVRELAGPRREAVPERRALLQVVPAGGERGGEALQRAGVEGAGAAGGEGQRVAAYPAAQRGELAAEPVQLAVGAAELGEQPVGRVPGRLGLVEPRQQRAPRVVAAATVRATSR